MKTQETINHIDHLKIKKLKKLKKINKKEVFSHQENKLKNNIPKSF